MPSGKSPKPTFHQSQSEQQQELLILNAFSEMDMDNNGRVSKDEFRRYISQHPQGWPLVDLLDGQPKAVKEQVIAFWFRKLDINNDGTFDQNELIAFFKAMRDVRYKEALYADFLLNLFDKNFDGNLSPEEFDDMLHVLLGPKASGLQLVPKGGLSRDELVKLLHRVHCDFNQIGSDGALGVGASSRSGRASFTDVAITVMIVGVAATAGYALLKAIKQRK